MIEQDRVIEAPQGERARWRIDGGQSSLALNNLRGLLILLLVAFHSVLAYLGSLNGSSYAFDEAPYMWRSFPVVDAHRWFGFDIFCAWQDVYLMSLMFFLSGVFTWPSLSRKGIGRYIADRLLRLGIPLIFGLAVVTPLALYPAYRLTAADPGPIAYIRHYLALPFLPNGPMWFLWLLIALTAVAVALHRFAPQAIARLGRLASGVGARPGRYCLALAAVAALAYAPLALAFGPWDWSMRGPFGFQLSRPLLYAVYFFAGIGVGAYGLERGLPAPDGALARRWRFWFGCALAAFVLWMGLTALSMNQPSFLLQAGAALSFALAGASGSFFMLAICLRFGAFRSRLFDGVANNAFGMYLLHFVFVVWLQYALLRLPLFSILKAGIVFGGAALLAYGATSALRQLAIGARLIGEAPRTPARAPAPRPATARESAIGLDRSQTAQ